MTPSNLARAAVAGIALLIAAACGSDSTGPPKPGPAAKLVKISGDSATGAAGTVLPQPVIVRVTDAKDVPVPNATVSFAVSAGNGSVSPVTAITDADGKTQTLFTLGTVAGSNQVTATEADVPLSVRFVATGMPGPAASLSLQAHVLRLPATVDTGHVSALVADQYGNGTTPGAAWTVRDPTLVSVDSTGFVRALRRGSSTYVVASAAARLDSVLVVVLAPGQSPCTGLATASSLAVGQVFTNISGGYVCVHADVSGSEYVLAPYFNASVPSSMMQVEVNTTGLGTLAASAAPFSASRSPSRNLALPGGHRSAGDPGLPRNDTFDYQLRQRERALEPLAGGARRWYSEMRATGTLGRPRMQLSLSRSGAGGLSAATAPAYSGIPSTAKVGDLISLNASLSDCTSPSYRVGRVAAITQKAVVIADTLNPAGGFTDADYQSIGTTFDTLVDPLDEQNFGAPSDIDNNGGRVVLFFTSAVNQLSPKGSNSIVLGFFYSRDLYPQTSTPTLQGCAGSNQGEMFYLLVPDTSGSVSVGPLSKSYVTVNTIGTTAHEYQHLINASRRLYVNHASFVDEESWLNEGLSHVAEELLFYRVSGLQPKQNIDSAAIKSVYDAYRNYHRNNAARYDYYLSSTYAYAPVGANLFDDALQTRGAIWSFLRYAADRRGTAEQSFWYNLVNSSTTGLTNLQQVLGTDPAPWMHDWAISNFTDDYVPGVAPQYTQPSWNARSYFKAIGMTGYPLDNAQLASLADGVQSQRTLRGGGITFMRFTVPAGQDALLTVTASSQPLPAAMQLAVIRVK